MTSSAAATSASVRRRFAPETMTMAFWPGEWGEGVKEEYTEEVLYARLTAVGKALKVRGLVKVDGS